MRFADADVTEEDDVGFLGEELQAEEVLDVESVDLFRPVPAELFQGLNDRKASGSDATLDRSLVALLELALDESAQIVDVAAGSLAGFSGPVIVMGFDEG
jgi:hypothetical protein